VVLRDQFLGDGRILDALADFARYKIRDQRVRLAVNEDVAEIALPDAEAACQRNLPFPWASRGYGSTAP
jgi:hypothetical protein